MILSFTVFPSRQCSPQKILILLEILPAEFIQANVSCNLSRSTVTNSGALALLQNNWRENPKEQFHMRKSKHCDTNCRKHVTLCNDWKICCSVVRIIAKSRTIAATTKNCEKCLLQGMLDLAIFVATKLCDKLHETLPCVHVTPPLVISVK